MHGLYNIVKKFVFFQTEQSNIVFINFADFSCSRCVKRVFYSAFVWKCTYMCKHHFVKNKTKYVTMYRSAEGISHAQY
jgi:hypothetical protein